MVGLVLVSHSRQIAQAAAEFAEKVSTKTDIPISIAGGVGDDRKEFGTDPTDIIDAINKVYSKEGVIILMDLGSAVISARMALELIDEDKAKNIVLCSAPLIEGAIGAAVQIAAGSNIQDIKEEALNSLIAKQSEIGDVEL
ncbi:MAG: PTS-dependent dihydroxyacetone kinase phosphotransferase subunit DhaM [Elusimicrobiota bacterium]|jgi:dihydroxyacetone kinase phosphotransfer subunit|nr:PTS-dependent dihydroxyacetone kinase phosphotransferase subunit DhaM [Elusimicrobiota bacterium]